MEKSNAIVLQESKEIMESLPYAMRLDDEIMSCVVESLHSGVSVKDTRLDAEIIARIKLEKMVKKGFELVNGEVRAIKHDQEIQKIHAQYTNEAVKEAKETAKQALFVAHEQAIAIARTEQKAENARDLAKQSSWFRFDPITGMAVCAFAAIAALVLMHLQIGNRDSKPQTNHELLTCGVEVTCIPNQSRKPIPIINNGGV
jgi:tellurite resistance protein/predicted outer membrane lipoprotein